MTIKVYGNHLVSINTSDKNHPRVITTSSEASAHHFSNDEATVALETLAALGYAASVS